jgi:hypothetical protein
MAITRVNIGALASAATGNVTPTLPAGLTASDGVTGVADLMWCLISTNSNVASTMPIEWTVFREINSSATLRGSLFWKRYEAGDTDPLVTHAGGTNNTTAARIIAYRGVLGTGNGMSSAQGTSWNESLNTANSTARTVTGVTTNVADCMIVYGGADGEEGTHATYTGTNPSGATLLANEAMDNGVTAGSDTGLWLTDALRSGAAGATGNIGCTSSITAPFVGWILALEPAAALPPQPAAYTRIKIGASQAAQTASRW